MAHFTGRDLKTLTHGELLEVRVEEVQYEANAWGNVARAVEDIVGLANGLRLPRESFDPNFFGEAVRGHADVTRKVLARCGEGVVVTKKIQDLLLGFAEHYRAMAVAGGRSAPAARPLPAPVPQPAPSAWQDNFARQFGLPSIVDLERTLTSIQGRSAALAEKLRELTRVADEEIKKLESFLARTFMPETATQLVQAIRQAVTKVLQWTGQLLEFVAWVVGQARLPIAMYDDARAWIAMRNKANEVNTWLSVNVLNPERALPERLRQQAWHGDVEKAYAAAIPAQEKAAGAIGLITMVTGGSLMGCFGAQVYVFSVLSSAIVDAIKLVVDLTTKIINRTIFLGWWELVFGEMATWLKNVKEGGLAVLQAEANSKVQADLMRVLVDDNTAFAYRADLQLYTSVGQLPTAWPDPTRAGSPWPRERRAPQGGRGWEVSRELVPPVPGRRGTGGRVP